jgi:putative hemolysin
MNQAIHQDVRNDLPRLTYVQPEDPWLRARLVGALEVLTGRRKVEQVYHRLKAEPFEAATFFTRALELADIRYSSNRAAEAQIPTDGPLVIIANHPFGVVDGVMLCDIAARIRGDFRILIHALLCQDNDLNPFFLPVDFTESREAQRRNIETKREAARLLENGGTLLVFPGGGVSTTGRGGCGEFADLPWTTFTAKLIHQSRATVVPVFFHGRNSRLFHLASGISMTLRAALLLHEASNKIGHDFHVEIGNPIDYGDISHLGRKELTRHLHNETWRLGEGHTGIK